MTIKNWIIVLGLEKFRVTEEDAKFYVEQVSKGYKFVVLKDGTMISDKALYVQPVERLVEAEMLEDKNWKCTYGAWHTNRSQDCKCSGEWKKKYEVIDTVSNQLYIEKDGRRIPLTDEMLEDLKLKKLEAPQEGGESL